MAQAVLFAIPHGYQGWPGATLAGFVGLLLAAVYLRFGRNLVMVILAHGAFDTVVITALFLGFAPG